MELRETDPDDYLDANGKHYFRFCSDEVIANVFLKGKSTAYVRAKGAAAKLDGRDPSPPCFWGYYFNEYFNTFENPHDELPF